MLKSLLLSDLGILLGRALACQIVSAVLGFVKFSLFSNFALKLSNSCDQVTASRAANTPVHHLDNLLVDLHFRVFGQQSVVDADVTEFIFDYGKLFTMRGGKDVVQQGGFATTKEAGEDGNGDAVGIDNGGAFSRAHELVLRFSHLGTN